MRLYDCVTVCKRLVCVCVCVCVCARACDSSNKLYLKGTDPASAQLHSTSIPSQTHPQHGQLEARASQPPVTPA